MKRIISISRTTFLLTICMLISIALTGILSSSASTISSSNNYYIYKEKYIKDYCTYDYLVNEMRLPYRSFVETLDEDTAFQVELDAWKLATISPDSLITDLTQSNQYRYYEAILIDLLVRDTQEESFVENVQSLKDTLHVSAWKKYVEYNSNTLKDIPINSENADVILAEMKSMGNFSKALKYADTIGDYIDYATDIYDLFDKLTKIEMIVQMSDSYAQVLSYMSSKCGSNVYLKVAIDDVSLIFSEDLSVEQIKAIFTTRSTADIFYKEFMKQVKKSVLNNLGMVGTAVDLAQSAGTAVANSWFGTEDMINDYYQMGALYEIEDLIRTTVLNTSGSTFCASFKLYENTCLMGCDYSKKYVEPLYTSLFGKLFAWATNQNYDAYSAQLDSLKEDLSFMFEMIDVGADSWYIIDTENSENMNDINKNFNIEQYSKDDYKNQNENVAMDVYSTYGGSNNSNNITLKSDLVIYNDFDITGGTINLNGFTLTINGKLQQKNGTMRINGGTLNIDGDYLIKNGEYLCNAYLIMTNKRDRINVGGDFWMESYKSHDNLLNAGTMTLKGDFRQINGHFWNFHCEGTHKVIFDGHKEQIINFFDTTSSSFSNVEFINTYIKIESAIGSFTLQNDAIINNDLVLYGSINLNGYTLTINGNLHQQSHTININGGTLNVNGDYLIYNDKNSLIADNFSCASTLKMINESDRVNIEGDFLMNSHRDNYGYLTAGIMTIKGDFTVKYATDGSSGNFHCSGTHTVIFDGNEEQTISFKDQRSRFSKVIFKNPYINIKDTIPGWTLQNDTTINNDLVLNIDGTLNLKGHTLTINGNLQQTSGTIYINGGILNINGNYNCSAYLKMTNENDRVNIGGDLIKSAGTNENYLTAGIMTLKGDFTQSGSKYTFYCKGTHTVILNGDNNVQKITFGSTLSRFNNLKLTKDKDTGYIFKPNKCWNVLLLPQEVVYTDNASGVSMSTFVDADLSVNEVVDTQIIDDVNAMLSNKIVEKFWDISLVSNNIKVGCNDNYVVKIPAQNELTTIYYVENDGTLTNMNATYEYGFMVFNTNSLGEYVVAVELEIPIYLGDVNGDGDINIQDATLLQLHLAKISDKSLIPNYSDVNQDGYINIQDVTLIQMYIAGYFTTFESV